MHNIRDQIWPNNMFIFPTAHQQHHQTVLPLPLSHTCDLRVSACDVMVSGPLVYTCMEGCYNNNQINSLWRVRRWQHQIRKTRVGHAVQACATSGRAHTFCWTIITVPSWQTWGTTAWSQFLWHSWSPRNLWYTFTEFSLCSSLRSEALGITMDNLYF